MANAIDFHERRALRFVVLRALLFAAAVAVVVVVPRWFVRVPAGIVAVLMALPFVLDRALLGGHRRKSAAIKADPRVVVWVHYDAHGEKICPVYLYDRTTDFAALHLPSGHARQLLDAFRASDTPPIITTTDEERRILEPRQRFLAKLHELEALAVSAPQPSLREHAEAALATLATLEKRFGTTLDAEGRAEVEETTDRLISCYGSRATRDVDDEIASLLAKLTRS